MPTGEVKRDCFNWLLQSGFMYIIGFFWDLVMGVGGWRRGGGERVLVTIQTVVDSGSKEKDDSTLLPDGQPLLISGRTRPPLLHFPLTMETATAPVVHPNWTTCSRDHRASFTIRGLSVQQALDCNFCLVMTPVLSTRYHPCNNQLHMNQPIRLLA